MSLHRVDRLASFDVLAVNPSDPNIMIIRCRGIYSLAEKQNRDGAEWFRLSTIGMIESETLINSWRQK